MYMDRKLAGRVGQETLNILRAGRYTNPEGQEVDLADDIADAVSGTRSYPPRSSVPGPVAKGLATRFEVTNEPTLTAARRLFDAGLEPVALNFASAKNPGGGFLGGARAQEESLARSSGLYLCLEGQQMYEHHRQRHDAMYTSWAIYSPAVPVFREDVGALLARPWYCAFVTCPAVNAGVVLSHDRHRGEEIRAEMERRVDRVLAVSAAHGHEALVLGAWGCGVFKNSPEVISELFRAALAERYAGVFSRVVFAILDSSEEERFIGPFRRRFAPGGS
jgi:uncharacterized protein (TIGR02452 family)